jgi:hypothetical protein
LLEKCRSDAIACAAPNGVAVDPLDFYASRIIGQQLDTAGSHKVSPEEFHG